MDIQQVREVLKMTRVTPLPQSAHYIEGVINLRGEVIPVVDLRKRFELPVGERGEQTRIIIVEIQNSNVGLIVDSVTEVLRFSSSAIQPPPTRVAGTRTDLIKGVGKVGDRLLYSKPGENYYNGRGYFFGRDCYRYLILQPV